MTDANSPIVITGGAQRLGLAVALALGQSGYPVVITYCKPRPILSKLERTGKTIALDGGRHLAQAS